MQQQVHTNGPAAALIKAAPSYQRQQAGLLGAVASQQAGLAGKAAQLTCACSRPPELAERVDVLDHREGHGHRHGHARLTGLRCLASWPCGLLLLLLLHRSRLQQKF
jgi:hypothetical protein